MIWGGHFVTVPCCVQRMGSGGSKDIEKENCSSKTNYTNTESLSGVLFFHTSKSNLCLVLSTLSLDLESSEETRSRSNSFLPKTSEQDVVNIQTCAHRQDTVFGAPVKALPLIAWKSTSFSNAFRSLFSPKSEWSYAEDDKGTKGKMQPSEYYSWFILYYVHKSELLSKYNVQELEISSPFWRSKQIIKSGANVVTRSFPFAPPVLDTFSDTVSSGIISNICDKDGALFLTDARCLPGSEGGGVYMEQTVGYFGSSTAQQLIGMIIVPLCWKNEELIGFTICCSIKEITSSLLTALNSATKSSKRSSHGKLLSESMSLVKLWLKDVTQLQWNHSHRTAEFSEPDVVRVDVGGVWGSGVVVAARTRDSHNAEVFIATCRHVIEKALQNDAAVINIYFRGVEKKYRGNVLFSTEENSSFDFALLSIACKTDFIQQLLVKKIGATDANINGSKFHLQFYVVPHATRSADFIKGGPVYVKGHGLFDAFSSNEPTISRGVMSSKVEAGIDDLLLNSSRMNLAFKQYGDKLAVLLHSSCVVHKGASGGALICGKTRKLQGIVINHIRDESVSVSYPHVNFSIPTSVFMPAVLDYLVTGEISSLDFLNCFSERIKNVWSLKESTENGQNLVPRSKL